MQDRSKLLRPMGALCSLITTVNRQSYEWNMMQILQRHSNTCFLSITSMTSGLTSSNIAQCWPRSALIWMAPASGQTSLCQQWHGHTTTEQAQLSSSTGQLNSASVNVRQRELAIEWAGQRSLKSVSYHQLSTLYSQSGKREETSAM